MEWSRRGSWTSAAMIVLGAIAGYVVLALASTVVQEVWLGGVSYVHSERSVLILAGVFTPLCAFAGGVVNALVAARARWGGAMFLALLIAVETTYLYETKRVDGPLWFEAGAAAALILAVGLGTLLVDRTSRRKSPS